MRKEGKKLLNMLVLDPKISSNTIFKHSKYEMVLKNKFQKPYIPVGTELLIRRGDN